LEQLHVLNRALGDLAVLRLPVGSAAEDASVVAIFSLAEHYPRLRETALAPLDGLRDPFTTEASEEYANQLRALLDEERQVDVAARAPTPTAR
jgi:hypothetical protein